jgi:thioredoxin reductase (NADPH)
VSESQFYDLVIVGGGPGGLTAGIYAMRAALNTVLVEKGLAGGQVANSDSVENYPGFESITGFDLSQKFLQHAQSYGLKIIQREAVSIEPGLDYHSVHLDNGNVLEAHSVILAAGGSPRQLDVPGEKEYYGKGISYCATCDGFFFREKTVVVVGGGDTAMEEALYLAKLAKHVYLVHRRDALRASRILQQRVMAECKIEILWNTIVTEIKADDQGVCAVALQDTKNDEQRELPTEGVFIFVGFLPNNQLVPAGVTMNASGYVMTDEKCETSIPGLYVVGDLRQKYARQIVVAAGDGCTAALAAAHHVETKKAAADTCELPQELLSNS